MEEWPSLSRCGVSPRVQNGWVCSGILPLMVRLAWSGAPAFAVFKRVRNCAA
jgi:hypothetical protein